MKEGNKVDYSKEAKALFSAIKVNSVKLTSDFLMQTK
jgi:hypothetical protein